MYAEAEKLDDSWKGTRFAENSLLERFNDREEREDARWAGAGF